MNKTGVLLVNLGTPDSPSTRDVYRYLKEFLLDPRVIDLPWWRRQLLVRGVIAPFRAPKSAETYKKVWTAAGSPLLVYGKQLREALQTSLGAAHEVALAMRYQQPDIREGLQQLKSAKVGRIVVLPLFPQYASATTGSVHQRVMKEVARWQVIPELRFISQFYDHPKLIQAFAERGKEKNVPAFDHVLFSFHGLPERQIRKAAVNGYCGLNDRCCSKISVNNAFCYRAQCFATARAVAARLSLPEERYQVTFQSRLGKDPWLTPFTGDVLRKLPEQGRKKVLVFAPSFICDCLETTYEIGIEYAELFEHAGGEKLQLVEGLNDHPQWVEALKKIVLSAFPQP